MAKPERKEKHNKITSGVTEEQLFGFTKEPSFNACQKEVDQYFDKKEKQKKTDHDNVYFATPPVNEQGDMLFVPDKKKPRRVRSLAREKTPRVSTQEEEQLRSALSSDSAISPEEEERLRSIVRKHCNAPDAEVPVFQDHCEVKNCAMNDKELQQLILYFVEIQKQCGSILTEQEELIESYRDLVSKQTNLLAELIETVGKGKP